MSDYTYDARLVRVVDGDTCFLVVSLGFHMTMEMDFRLYGLNAPEMHGPNKAIAERAKEFLHGQLVDADLEIETKKSDKYGRWLATIYVKGVGGVRTNVNELLVSKGFAVPYDGKGPRPEF
jgi:endonuclease YncB( thermonuclease family)